MYQKLATLALRLTAVFMVYEGMYGLLFNTLSFPLNWEVVRARVLSDSAVLLTLIPLAAGVVIYAYSRRFAGLIARDLD